MEIRNKVILISLIAILAFSCSIPFEGKEISSGAVGFSETANPTSTVSASLVTGTVNVRSCPSTTCGVVGYLYAGQKTHVLTCIGNWCKVVEKDFSGYVYEPCLEISKNKDMCK